jgi:hypothetical protein
LPTNDPAGDLTFLKPKGGDVFRRVRKDGSEAEEITFVRDATGKISGFLHHSNTTRMESLLPNTKISIKQ